MDEIVIRLAQGALLDEVQTLWREYQVFLGIDLGFQGFEEEMAGLPGKYAALTGGLFVAMQGDEALGAVAFYKLEDGVAEIKRLYVRPEARGLRLGERLMRHVLDRARECGYDRVRLDSLARLKAAAQLYGKFGFYEIAPYNHNPHGDVYYMECILERV